ncbi:AAA family ATPase [Nonomuraea turcica]|uniref:AAA family ATPase n=1 Tax=Nonomuraea sp. G32 TaxID=3067274 RepID=UPI00273BD9D1|nr:AAA family ATPase [Nonomuraea sp. G32]MDP4511485.1 AAA family ATPase [Nonomuraea sp. G32]
MSTLAIEGYRSLRQLVLPLAQLNVVTGANGSGKSSLYRALRLLADSSRNGAVAALARQGGLPSTLWAGPEVIGRAVREGRYPVQGTVRSGPVSLRLGFAGDDFGYAMDLGLPSPTDGGSAFQLDPEIKAEAIWSGPVLRPAAVLAERGRGAVRVRQADGGWWRVPGAIQPFDSMLSEIADPQRTPELLALRERIRTWRFYDQLRTDANAPARASQIGTRTFILDHDGADLAAALQTIREIGDHDALVTAIDHAFPGSRLEVAGEAGRFELRLHQHGLLRPLHAAELSDGTLRYLFWVAALLTPRAPALLVLNEPETSLHPDLIAPLADLAAAASARTQIIVVTHNPSLVAALSDQEARTIELVKEHGQTAVAGQDSLDEPPWHWPKR